LELGGPLSPEALGSLPTLPKVKAGTAPPALAGQIKNHFNSSMVLAAVVLDIVSMISGHFEWASTASKCIRFKNGPAKSTCTLLQDFVGHNHGCSGAGGAVFHTDWQYTHTVLLSMTQCRNLVLAIAHGYVPCLTKLTYVTTCLTCLALSSVAYLVL